MLPSSLMIYHRLPLVVVAAVALLSCCARSIDAFSIPPSITTFKTTTHDVNVVQNNNVECDGNNKILCMHATASSSSSRDDDERNSISGNKGGGTTNNKKNKSSSLFEMPKMPWDVNNDDDNDDAQSEEQQQWQWWPNNNNNSETSSQTLATTRAASKSSSSSNAAQQQTRQTRSNKQQQKQQRRRVPRYPSALQYDSNVVSMNSSLKVDDKENNTNDDDVDKYVQSAQDALSLQSTTVVEETSMEEDESNNNNNQPRNNSSSSSSNNRTKRTLQKKKLGILLIDHGSKRMASNEHLHTIANLYQDTLNDKILSSAATSVDAVAKKASSTTNNDDDDDDVPSSATTTNPKKQTQPKVVVKAAHMEIATPSIHTQLTSLIENEDCTTIICIPYFLSPGKHATIDVPNLIQESKVRLDKDGLLDYYYEFVERGGNDEDGSREVVGNKKEKVTIHLSKALGTNVDSMLHVVNGLVSMTLQDTNGGMNEDKGDDIIMFQQLFSNDDPIIVSSGDGNNDNEVQEIKQFSKLVGGDEIQKYENRVSLLEFALKAKVKELNTMKNRVVLMEDALGKLLQKDNKNQQKDETTNDDGDSEESSKEREQKLLAEEEVATLKATIDTVNREKERLVNEIESMMMQRTEMENEYATNVADLKAQLASLEKEMQLLKEEKAEHEQQNQEEHEQQQRMNETSSTREVNLQDEIQQQTAKIQGLQTQLADLLDAHTELEQLQHDTETNLNQLQLQLKETHTNHETALDAEREKTKSYRQKWMDVLGEMEEDACHLLMDQYNIWKPQELFDEAEKNYEVLLEEERAKVDEWREKYDALVDSSGNNDTSATHGLASVIIDTTRSEEEWINLQNELEEITRANENATSTVQELEKQLHDQQQKLKEKEELEENKSATQKEVEQLQKLQEYLQAQLSEYYETIKEQKSRISEYDQKIQDLEKSHEESMLIATNSVEASQRREETLLSSIEELESDLAIANMEKDDKHKVMMDLQARIDKMEDDRETLLKNDRDAAAASSTKKEEELTRHNEELTMKIERLEYRVQEVTKEKEQIWLEKRKIQMEMIVDMKDDMDDGVLSRDGHRKPKQLSRRRRFVRAVLRPWTLLRR